MSVKPTIVVLVIVLVSWFFLRKGQRKRVTACVTVRILTIPHTTAWGTVLCHCFRHWSLHSMLRARSLWHRIATSELTLAALRT